MCEFSFKIEDYEIDVLESTLSFSLNLRLNLGHRWDSFSLVNKDYPEESQTFSFLKQRPVFKGTVLQYKLYIDKLRVFNKQFKNVHICYKFVGRCAPQFDDMLSGEFTIVLNNSSIHLNHDLSKIKFEKVPMTNSLAVVDNVVVNDCWRKLSLNPPKWEELSEMNNLEWLAKTCVEHAVVMDSNAGYNCLRQATDSILPIPVE